MSHADPTSDRPLQGDEVRATDYHTAGEPFRIVTSGVPEIGGSTVSERRQTAQRDDAVQRIRRLLCHEPRGHADMFGCFVVPPDDEGAAFGAIFWHKDGLSTACGHGTIALGTWAADTGLVAAAAEGDTDIAIDTPAGRVVARVHRLGGRTASVTFRNVASYVIARNVEVQTSRGPVRVDLGFGGAIYASLPAASVGLAVEPASYQPLIAVGREVKRALDGHALAQHPADPSLSGVYGTVLYDELAETPRGPHQRNVTVFADGAVDRSPCGTGTAVRVALLSGEGRLPDGSVLTHESIVRTRFRAQVAARTTINGREAVIPEVEGSAYRTGEHVFVLDPADPLGTGFVLR